MSGRRVVVTGAGLVSPLGDSPAALHAALVAGRSGVGPAAGAPAAEAARQVAELAEFDAAEHLGGKRLRPLDRTARLAASAAKLALESAGWPPQAIAATEVGLVLGTMFGSVRTISEFDRRTVVDGPSYARPIDFANTVLNAAAGQTAIRLDLRGVNATVSGDVSSGLQAIAYAADLIRAGQADVLLAGGADELCGESLSAFESAGWSCGTHGTAGRPVPYDRRRDGFAPGEGAAFLVLEEAAAARRRGARVVAEVRGHGAGFDGSRGGEPRRASEASARAARLALAEAGLLPDDLDALSASASGSRSGDRHEAAAMGAVFGRGASRLPLTAVKSMTGECMGASGALQAIALIESMHRGVLPGIAGLEEVEEGFPLGVERGSRQVEIHRGLAHAHGLDGQCASVVFERGPEALS